MSAKKFCSRACSQKYRTGEKHPMWKGDEASYSALHKWITKKYGKPSQCFSCGSKDKMNWANVSRTYTRERKDWIELCASCHKHFDVNSEKRDVIINRWEKLTGNKARLLG